MVIFVTAPKLTVMAAAFVALPIVMFLAAAPVAEAKRISKSFVTLLLKVSERTVLSLAIVLVVRLFALVALKRRSVVSSKVGTAPSQFNAEFQLPDEAAAPPLNVVPAEA